MQLTAQVCCLRKQSVFREVEGAIPQTLTKGSVHQNPTIAGTSIAADVNHPEVLLSIHNCQESAASGKSPVSYEVV